MWAVSYTHLDVYKRQGRDRAKISYSKVAAAKYKALEMVFDALGFLSDSSFDRFREDNQDWLENYALFAAIYEQFQYCLLYTSMQTPVGKSGGIPLMRMERETVRAPAMAP